MNAKRPNKGTYPAHPGMYFRAPHGMYFQAAQYLQAGQYLQAAQYFQFQAAQYFQAAPGMYFGNKQAMYLAAPYGPAMYAAYARHYPAMYARKDPGMYLVGGGGGGAMAGWGPTSFFADPPRARLASGEPIQQPSSPPHPAHTIRASQSTGTPPHNQVTRLSPGIWPPGRPLRVVNINAALISAGIENWLASLSRYSNPQRLKFARCLVLSNWVDNHQVRRLQMPVTVGNSKQAIQSAIKDADVLIVSDPGGNAGQLADWIAEVKPKVTLFVMHGDGDYTSRRLSAFRNVADHFVAVSRHVQQSFAPMVDSTLIRNGVDPERLVETRTRNENRERLGFGPKDFVVGFVGRFSPEKNPLSVLHAVSQLPPNCKALMVGFGPMRQHIIEAGLQHLPSRFTLVDGHGLNNLGDLYRSMDALTMPSTLEGFGLVAMEAMMCGVPVVLTPIGIGNDLFVDRVNGLLVQPHPSSIAGALGQLRADRRWARTVGRNGKKTAREFGFATRMTEDYENLIASLWCQSTAA